MIKAAIFDLDGLLADTEIISYKIYRDILKKEGIAFTKEEYARNYSGKTEIANIERIIRTYGLNFSTRELKAIVLDSEKALIDKGVDLKDGAIDLLRELDLKGVKVALATSSTKERALTILRQNDIDQYFDVFICAEDITSSKPDPEVFLKALEQLGVEKDEALILEDSENGIKAANSAGINVICIPDLKTPKDEYLKLTKATLKTLRDALPYVI